MQQPSRRSVMSATFGAPPKADEPVMWDYYDKDGKAATWAGTLKEFYRALAYDITTRMRLHADINTAIDTFK